MLRQIFTFCWILLGSLFLLPVAHTQHTSIWNQYSLGLEQAFKYESGTVYQFFFQDSRGFIWGADEEYKLIRFDGQTIESFRFDPLDTASHSGCDFWWNMAKFLEDGEGKIWILSSQSCLDRYDPSTGRFEKFRGRLQRLAGEEKIQGKSSYIFEDSRKNIWIAMNVGVFRYALPSKELRFFDTPGNATLVFEDAAKNIWVNVESGNNNRYLTRLDEATGKLSDQVALNLPIALPSYFNRGDEAVRLENGNMFLLHVGFNLFLFNPRNHQLEFLPNSPFHQHNYPSCLYAKNDLVLIGSQRDELFQWLPRTLGFEKYEALPVTPPHMSAYLANVFQSRDGIIWLANSEGVIKLLPKTTFLKKIPFPDDVPGFKKDVQYAGVVLPLQGQVYFNTLRGLKPMRESSQHQQPALNLKIASVRNQLDVMYQFDSDDDGNLWMAAFWRQDGENFLHFRKFDKAGAIQFQHTCQASEPGCVAKSMFTLRFLEADRKGGLWIGEAGSASYFDPQTTSFQRHFSTQASNSPIHGSELRCLYVDRENDLWIGSNTGLLRFNPATDKWTSFDYGAISKDGNENMVYVVFQDSKGAFWAGTEQALVKFDKQTKRYRRYTVKDLLPSNSVRKIFEDHRQNLWVATSMYLACYNPQTDCFNPFESADGLEPTSYFNREVFQDNEHYIYLPSNSFEVNYFHPDSFVIDRVAPPIIFTSLELFGQLVRPGDSTAILQKSLDFTEKVTLKYAQNDFTIHYTAPEFIHPNETVFAIQLEGFNDDWQEVGTKREARYTNLSPGTYTFKVKVRNHHGFWSEATRSLKIVVLPPWYRTWWAYLLYVLTIGGILFAIRNYELKRQLAKAEAQRLQELDLAKSRLYTNITHEFRTPLTVILGMTEQVKNDPKNWFNEGLQLIRRNGKQLLNLVNQLLDLSKLESGHMPLNLVQGDIVNYLKYLTESFHSYADSKDIRLHFRSDFPELQMDHDPEKLQNVLSNLLSNAIKFTPAGGDVYVDLRMPNADLQLEDEVVNGHSSIVIQVTDTGVGIAPEHLPRIFDRFYQADDTHTRRGDGTGIGLALAKELVKVMGGSIGVESELGKGTKISIRLPIVRTATVAPVGKEQEANANLLATVILEAEKVQEAQAIESNDRFTVLLVEDNPDVITYLSSVLNLHYRIVTARNGQEGIDKAFELTPDVIVSDVMMPGKDGFELCRELKTDERTSHIPIVLLTAKADQKSKIEGLTHGADAYLAKPFHQEELLVRLEKLIELRRRMQERFSRFDKISSFVKSEPANLEDAFLQKVIRVIESQMADENFGMPQLCKALHMDRTNLFRKLKALTGKSATHLIRSVRLGKAKLLLETTDRSVSEVCYEVGFNNPNYFSTVFKEEFGMPPSAMRKG